MPRPSRIALENLTYHIVNRGNNDQTVFREEKDFSKYIELLNRYKEKFCFRLYAYCLMNNHVHLLIEPTRPKTLSKIMQSLTTAHTKLYHYKYKTNGHLWQGRFKNPVVQTDEYLLECIKYIELNPVRAKIVDSPEKYKWSSFSFHANGAEDILLDAHPVYLSLGINSQDRIIRYRNFVIQDTSPHIVTKIRHSVEKGLLLADELFERQIVERLKLSRPKKRGRPRKII